jgi:hypothetical protein
VRRQTCILNPLFDSHPEQIVVSLSPSLRAAPQQQEMEEERRAEAEELGPEVEEPLFLPTPAFMASVQEE